MKISEFVSKENLAQKNPFDKCAKIERITMNDYMSMATAAEKIIFNEKNNLYRALFREFAVRVSAMTVMLGLEMNEDEYEIDDVFQAVMCSGIWNKFVKNVAEKIAPDFVAIINGINTYLDDEVEKNRVGTRKMVEEVVNTLVTLVESDGFQQMLEGIEVADEDEKGKISEVEL